MKVLVTQGALQPHHQNTCGKEQRPLCFLSLSSLSLFYSHTIIFFSNSFSLSPPVSLISSSLSLSHIIYFSFKQSLSLSLPIGSSVYTYYNCVCLSVFQLNMGHTLPLLLSSPFRNTLLSVLSSQWALSYR